MISYCLLKNNKRRLGLRQSIIFLLIGEQKKEEGKNHCKLRKDKLLIGNNRVITTFEECKLSGLNMLYKQLQ
jgi:hypothetical protein